MRITWPDYFKGRDEAYAKELTLEIRRNAQHTIDVINAVLAMMVADGVDLTGWRGMASGWRPPEVNDHTANAASHSPHLTAEGGDLTDFPDRRLVCWALANPDKLKACGVRGMERPQWTPTWLHIQTRAPASGHFCFVPSSAPAKVAALPGELHPVEGVA